MIFADKPDEYIPELGKEPVESLQFGHKKASLVTYKGGCLLKPV